MKSFRYAGEPANIGRWGWCAGGEILEMTDDEAAGVEGDKRFQAVSPAKESSQPEAPFEAVLPEPDKPRRKK